MADATADWTHAYLRKIEELGVGSEYESLYLWPRTPLTPDHQEVIAKRVGADDYAVDDPRSRSAMIIRKLRELTDGADAPLPQDARVVDLACGDAVVLWQVKKALPQLSCFGVDCNKGVFATNASAEEEGVELYSGYLQHVFAEAPPEPFDLTMMLNTYRGWESADLRDSERDLPQLADAWFAEHSRYTIVTATEAQIKRLRRQGWRVEELGKGEDVSTMICLSRDGSGSAGLLGRLRGWLGR
jgi:hypothetical protein